MKPRKLTIAVASLGLVGALSTAPFALAGQPHEERPSDGIHRSGTIGRTIVIDDRTKSVNVTEGEIIRFLVNGPGGQKSFAWAFDSLDDRKDLKQIAPDGVLGNRAIKVYVASDPRGRL